MSSSEDMQVIVETIESEMQRRQMKAFSPISKVSVVFSKNHGRSVERILRDITFNVQHQSPTAFHLFQNTLQSLTVFEQSGMFKSVDVEFSPSSEKDHVEVSYKIEPTSFYFANISHQFDRFGQASMTSKLGFRNVLGYFDKLSFEYNKTLNKSKRSFYNLQWNLPYNFFTQKFEDNFLAALTHSTTMLDKNCSENKDGFTLTYSSINKDTQSESYNLAWESSIRQNYVTAERYRLLEDFVPSTKHSIKFATTAYSNLKFGSRVHKGSSLNYSIEAGIPGISDAVFVKSEANFKGFLKLKNFKRISQRFRSMNLEFSTNLGVVKAFSNFNNHDTRLPLNECFSMSSIRGINDIEVDDAQRFAKKDVRMEAAANSWHDNMNVQLKQSLKWNLYDFPGLQNSGVIPFYHASAGYFFRQRAGQGAHVMNGFTKEQLVSHLKSHVRASAGVGLAIGIGGNAKAELLYNFFHFAKPNDALTNLELRISVDD